ncbi:helix-turn-helix domain-containing protein [Nocardiopsis ansamitocini]|uniref:Transcriptional regulator n=1 Tax=Nocardiopsis ansamitocini TaxID=1670832 RepID=A0A9W6PB19_9ACTN|nr:helix-turn-helix transcriptional regulator [Nocardiopsis ansamitocini]GLU50289.1 transcriptional regulator [Nocardiopsis ansamitocini]
MPKRVKSQWLGFGGELKRWREQAGLTQGQLGDRVSISYGLVSAFERGVQAPKLEHIERIDQALSSKGSLIRLWHAANKGNGLAAWFRGLATLIQQASELREYNPMLIPGLLQTESYARAILRAGQPSYTDDEVEEQVSARMSRQSVLTSHPQRRPPHLVEILDEAVLRRPVGGAEVMAQQLTRLLEATSESRVIAQVIPLSTEYPPGLSEAFSLFTVPDRGEAVYMETRMSALAIDDAKVVAAYTRHFGDLRGAALPPPASRKLIEEIRGEFS